MKTTKHTLETFTDKYFLRSKEILRKDGLNPWVRAQVFVRKGPGVVAGLNEAVNLIKDHSNLEAHGGSIKALRDGDSYSPGETFLVMEGPIDDLVALETTYLGVLSAGLTKANDGQTPDYDAITSKTQRLTDKLGERPLIYFGARHWHYEDDAAIAAAAIRGGAAGASTDAGANMIGKQGVGTIPHALENIYAYYYGMEEAVKASTKAFDRHIDARVPRIALIDYNNREIEDAISTADALEGRLSGVRVDTCGENTPQGGAATYQEAQTRYGINVPEEQQRYWAGTGVTISGVYELRKALDAAGHDDVTIILSSGFGDEQKVDAFLHAEDLLKTKLFDGLGVGSLYHSRAATMDIVAVGEEKLEDISKVGRSYKPNDRLR